MIIVLNGPLGIGKSTLADALVESIEDCVMFDGDRLLAMNPPAPDPLATLHSTLGLLVAHHRRSGYSNFVLDYIWKSPAELADLRQTLGVGSDEFRTFLLTLPMDENIRRIEQRARSRMIDTLDFERRTVAEERRALRVHANGELGEPFDVSASPEALVTRLLQRLAEP